MLLVTVATDKVGDFEYRVLFHAGKVHFCVRVCMHMYACALCVYVCACIQGFAAWGEIVYLQTTLSEKSGGETVTIVQVNRLEKLRPA